MANTLPERLFELAAESPDREYVRFRYPDGEDRVWTRADFLNAAQTTAAQLAAAGVGPDDLVVIVQRDLPTLVATFFGATLLDAIPSILPFATEKLDPRRYREAMAALVRVSHPPILATEAGVVDDVRGIMIDVPPEDAPSVLVIDLDQPADAPALPTTYDPDNIALLQHSSGTTGLQKGVALAHRAIFAQLEAYGEAVGFSDEDIIVSWLPLYHDMGLIAGFLMPLLGGARLVLMSPFDWVRAPHMLLQAISDEGGTLAWLPNFAYNFCAQKIRDDDLEGVDLSTMRAFINCSEPVYDSSHRRFAERFAPHGITMAKLSASYAMAEAVFGVTQSPPGQGTVVDEVDRRLLRGENIAQSANGSDRPTETLVSSGRPIRGMEVRVLDPDMNPLNERRVGQIAIRAPYLLKEYYHRPDATEAAFHEGWYLTGDMGYRADGEVFVLGRKKDLLIVGGRNVYPQDLEALASSVDGVHPGRVAAFGIPNPEAGTEEAGIVAEVETDDEAEHGRIRAAIRRAISQGSDIAVRHVWLVPREWLIKTSSGKVARSANRDKILAEDPVYS